jgi:hypothetical protein
MAGTSVALSAAVVAAAAKKLRAITAALVAVGLCTAATASPAQASNLNYAQIVQGEAAYVASAQMTTANGCSANSPALGGIADVAPDPADSSSDYSSPYVAEYGAFALIVAGGSTYLNDAFNFIQWYLNNVNYYASEDTYQGVAGTIFDYNLDYANCTETSLGEYDASDSLGALFLSLVNAFVQADPAELPFFEQSSIVWDVNVIANSIIATQNSNGLTSSLKENMPDGEYTEDNVEVARGLNDYVTLLNAEGDSSGASWWEGYAAEVTSGIVNYEWLASSGAYLDAADQTTAGWSPCGAGLINMFPAGDLLNTIIWQQSAIPDYTSANGTGWEDTTPDDQQGNITCNTWSDTESFTAYAAAQTGATAAANTWLANAVTNWIDAGHPYPWVVGDSGWTAMTAYILETGTTENF